MAGASVRRRMQGRDRRYRQLVVASPRTFLLLAACWGLLGLYIAGFAVADRGLDDEPAEVAGGVTGSVGNLPAVKRAEELEDGEKPVKEEDEKRVGESLEAESGLDVWSEEFAKGDVGDEGEEEVEGEDGENDDEVEEREGGGSEDSDGEDVPESRTMRSLLRRKRQPAGRNFCQKHPTICAPPLGKELMVPPPQTIKASFVVANARRQVYWKTKALILSSINQAIARIPARNKAPIIILIMPGTYNEKVIVNKPKVTIIGLNRTTTIIQWGDYASKKGKDGKMLNTNRTATVWANARDFTMQGITVLNLAQRPDPRTSGGQAVAFMSSGDRTSIYDCHFISWQDTVYADKGRQFYKDTLVEGSVDFVFGDGQALFVQCTLYCRGDGFVTAQRRTGPDLPNGFVFRDSAIFGVGHTFLGRPWGVYSRVFFINCFMDSNVDPIGWQEWRGTGDTIVFAESGSYGPGAGGRSRVSWAKRLTLAGVNFFGTQQFLGPESWVKSKGPLGVSLSRITSLETLLNHGELMLPASQHARSDLKNWKSSFKPYRYRKGDTAYALVGPFGQIFNAH